MAKGTKSGKGNFIIDETGDEPLDLLGHGGQKGVRESEGKRRKSVLGSSKVLKEEDGRIVVEVYSYLCCIKHVSNRKWQVPDETTEEEKPLEREELGAKKKGLGRLAEVRLSVMLLWWRIINFKIRAAKKGARRARLQHDVKGLDQCAPGRWCSRGCIPHLCELIQVLRLVALVMLKGRLPSSSPTPMLGSIPSL